MEQFIEPSRRILIFGDSNTYGHDPVGPRYGESVRWPCKLQQLLGPNVRIIEEGLCGRTCVTDDPAVPGRRGLDYLFPCLMSHSPLDTLVIMLGTNDTKEPFGLSAELIAHGLGELLDTAMNAPVWKAEPDILVVCPFPIDPCYSQGLYRDSMGKGCCEKSRQLAPLFEEIAKQYGCRFADAATFPNICVNPLDGIHLTEKAHLALAEALVPFLKSNDSVSAKEQL